MSTQDEPHQRLFESGVYVRLSNIDAGYQSNPVLQQVSFDAAAGEVALLCGPTSAGKTTMMHVLRLALIPGRGRQIILGHDASRLNRSGRAKLKRRIGYVAENPSFVEHWSAFENIAMPLKLAGERERDYGPDVEELIAFVGLEDMNSPVSQLSAAARRLAAIARALATKPELILADDPTSGMSPEAGRRVVRLLMEMRRVGAAVVIASQDESLTEVGPCRLWRIARGRVTPAGDFTEDHEDAEYG